MITTITKSYRETDYKNFILYDSGVIRETNVFYEYYDLLRNSELGKDDIINIIKEYNPMSKARINIGYFEDRIEFSKSSVFPVFYIVFKQM